MHLTITCARRLSCAFVVGRAVRVFENVVRACVHPLVDEGVIETVVAESFEQFVAFDDAEALREGGSRLRRRSCALRFRCAFAGVVCVPVGDRHADRRQVLGRQLLETKRKTVERLVQNHGGLCGDFSAPPQGATQDLEDTQHDFQKGQMTQFEKSQQVLLAML